LAIKPTAHWASGCDVLLLAMLVQRLIRVAKDWFTTIVHHEVGALLASLAVVVGGWGFIVLASEVAEGDTQAFDDWIMVAVRSGENPSAPAGPAWLTKAALDITALGGVSVLAIIILMVSGYLWLRRKRHAMWLVVIATVGGQLLSTILKFAFGRPRPDNTLHLVEVSTASFPSGHSMLSAVVYLTLGALLARIEARRRVKTYVVAVALLLSLLIGLSRVYLGVHYPTDVLAGWAAGLTWALTCWTAARYLQRRGAVETEGENDVKPV
jgi:undecaprenyl-diphosphatase